MTPLLALETDLLWAPNHTCMVVLRATILCMYICMYALYLYYLESTYMLSPILSTLQILLH